jgi:hypothetical protein
MLQTGLCSAHTHAAPFAAFHSPQTGPLRWPPTTTPSSRISVGVGGLQPTARCAAGDGILLNEFEWLGMGIHLFFTVCM